MPRAIGSLAVCPSVKPTGEPDALIGHVRFDERGWETERCRMAQATAPILDSTVERRSSGIDGPLPNAELSRTYNFATSDTTATLKIVCLLQSAGFGASGFSLDRRL